MKSSRLVFIIGAFCAPLASFSAPSAPTARPVPAARPAPAPAAPQGFEAFRIVRTRNIFDPLRNPFVAAPVAQRPRYVPQQPRRSMDYVTLTGVMVTGTESRAFFSGSQIEYDKVLPVNGEIAGAKLTKITAGGIEVDRSGKKISVAVGQTVPFDGSAPGVPPAAPVDSGVPAPAAAAPGAPPTGDLPQTPNAPPGNISDVMRRMMERRQQQLQ
jgi:hypothetical protein